MKKLLPILAILALTSCDLFKKKDHELTPEQKRAQQILEGPNNNNNNGNNNGYNQNGNNSNNAGYNNNGNNNNGNNGNNGYNNNNGNNNNGYAQNNQDNSYNQNAQQTSPNRRSLSTGNDQSSYSTQGNSNSNSEENVAAQAYIGACKAFENRNYANAEALFTMTIGSYNNMNKVDQLYISSFYFLAAAQSTESKMSQCCQNLQSFFKLYNNYPGQHTELVEKAYAKATALSSSSCR